MSTGGIGQTIMYAQQRPPTPNKDNIIGANVIIYEERPRVS
jgi:hypothetical protein